MKTQAERLADVESLREELEELESRKEEIEAEIEDELSACTHEDEDGVSALYENRGGPEGQVWCESCEALIPQTEVTLKTIHHGAWLFPREGPLKVWVPGCVCVLCSASP